MDIVDGNLFEAMRIILPEHRAEMKRMEQVKKARSKPNLSEEALAEMSYTLSTAIQDDRQVRLELFGTYENDVVHGRPVIQNGRVYIITDQGKQAVPVDRIVSLSLV